MDGGIFSLRSMLIDTIRGNDSSRQLAFGVALGMLLGLVPKDNLTSVMLATLILTTRVNLLAALISAFAFAGVGSLFDPFIHRLGLAVLATEFAQPTFAAMLEMPLVPWTNFNNTIVAGSLFVGGCFLLPVYFISEFFFREYAPTIHSKLAGIWVYRMLSGASQTSQ